MEHNINKDEKTEGKTVKEWQEYYLKKGQEMENEDDKLRRIWKEQGTYDKITTELTELREKYKDKLNEPKNLKRQGKYNILEDILTTGRIHTIDYGLTEEEADKKIKKLREANTNKTKVKYLKIKMRW